MENRSTGISYVGQETTALVLSMYPHCPFSLLGLLKEMTPPEQPHQGRQRLLAAASLDK